jgi:glycosyltransferase involved in cell wall biosynthesis
LIARHYPPAASGGARRPYLLTRALRDLGAEIFVVAPSLPEGESGVAVPHPNRDPSTASGPVRTDLRNIARDWLLWPDPDIRWTHRAADAAFNEVGEAPDWVLTTSPPESIHAAGLILKRRWPSVRWAADFRDHWLDAPHRRERLRVHRRFGEKAIAKRWLSKADLVTCVDDHVAREMQSLGAGHAKVLAHFAPPSLGAPAALTANALNLVHAGSIMLSDPLADIEEILRPFENAVADNQTLRLHFVGRLTDLERDKVRKSAAARAIELHGVKPYDEALGYIAGADGLVYIASKKGKVPPSKIVEYLATEKPIFACGQGPWRDDPRVDNADPAASMAALRKGDVRKPAARPPSAADTAARLIALFEAAR